MYYGFWPLIALIVLAHVFWEDVSIRSLKRGIGATAGFLSWFIFFSLLWEVGSSRRQFWEMMMKFSHSIDQGLFSEGWSLPLAFLWHGEHMIWGLWLVGTFLAAMELLRKGTIQRKRTLLWLFFVVGLYSLLVVNSVFLHRFVVYGRLVRPIIPFLSLSAATGLWGFTDRFPDLRRGKSAILFSVLVVLLAIPNWRVPLQQHWPHDIIRATLAEFGNVAHRMSITGPETQHVLLIDRVMRFPPPPSYPIRYVLVNVDYPYPVTGIRPVPQGRVVFRYPHPLSYLPYQYEGWTPEARKILRSVDLSMRLIDTQQK